MSYCARSCHGMSCRVMMCLYVSVNVRKCRFCRRFCTVVLGWPTGVQVIPRGPNQESTPKRCRQTWEQLDIRTDRVAGLCASASPQWACLAPSVVIPSTIAFPQASGSLSRSMRSHLIRSEVLSWIWTIFSQLTDFATSSRAISFTFASMAFVRRWP